MKQSQKSVLLWLVLIALVVAVVQIITADATTGTEVPYSTFRTAVEEGYVEDVTIYGDGRIEGTFTDDVPSELVEDGQTSFTTVGRVTEDMQDLLVAREVEFTFRRDEPSLWQPILSLGVPLLFVVLIFFVFMRQMQSGNGKAMSFGKSKARLLNESQNKVTFDDVSGVEEAKEELTEIIDFLKEPKKYTRLGGRIPKGVLLMGPPGTGKTLLARGVAGEAGVPFFSISGSDFVEMFVGVGASRVRDLFEQGKKHAPCIIFIDEIDAVGRHRGAGMGGGHDEREQTLNQLLVEMDGFESNDGVILIAATNRVDVLDPALLRPGRFDRRIVVPRPDVAGRRGILNVHTRKTPLAPDVDLEIVAKSTPGFSGADLENLVNEAALIAARRNKDRVEAEDFDHAKDKVIMGAERKSAIISEQDRKVTAYHEAGHTLVAAMMPQNRDVDPVHKVTIIPRGQALGVTQQLPDEDRLNMTRTYALNRIAILMGGRIAEHMIFNQITTGASQDIKQATSLARKMVCEWGMSEKLGPIFFSNDNHDPFLGRDYGHASSQHSEKTAFEIDSEVRRIVEEQHRRAEDIIVDNAELLRQLAEALLEYESLDGKAVKMVLAGELDRLPDYMKKAEPAKREPKTGFITTDVTPAAGKPAAGWKPAKANGEG